MIVECNFLFHALTLNHLFHKDAAESPALVADLSKRDMANMKGGSSGADRREAKREERQKKATSGSKGGSVGGRGGRETKTKKVSLE